MHSFSEKDIPSDWRELLGDYLQSSAWSSLKNNLQSVLDQGSDLIRPAPESEPVRGPTPGPTTITPRDVNVEIFV